MDKCQSLCYHEAYNGVLCESVHPQRRFSHEKYLKTASGPVFGPDHVPESAQRSGLGGGRVRRGVGIRRCDPIGAGGGPGGRVSAGGSESGGRKPRGRARRVPGGVFPDGERGRTRGGTRGFDRRGVHPRGGHGDCDEQRQLREQLVLVAGYGRSADRQRHWGYAKLR